MYRSAPWIVLIVAVFFLYKALTPVQSANIVYLEPRIIDFGEVKQREEFDKTAYIHNATKHKLIVTDVISRCDCLASAPEEKYLEPDAKVALQVRWDSGVRRGKTKTAAEVLLKDENGKVNTVEIPIKAVVLPHIKIEPEEVIFDFTKDQTKTDHRIKLTNQYADIPFEIIKIESDHPAINCSYLKSSQELSIQFNKRLWNEYASYGIVRISTNSRFEGRLQLPIFVRE